MKHQLLITVSLRDQILQQCAFEKSPVKIGRHRACDIVLDNPAASRVHAEIRWEDGTAWLEDAGSSNGILLNSRRVSREALTDGDVISIGKFTLHVGIPADRPETTRSGTLSGRDLTIHVPPHPPGRS